MAKISDKRRKEFMDKLDINLMDLKDNAEISMRPFTNGNKEMVMLYIKPVLAWAKEDDENLRNTIKETGDMLGIKTMFLKEVNSYNGLIDLEDGGSNDKCECLTDMECFKKYGTTDLDIVNAGRERPVVITGKNRGNKVCYEELHKNDKKETVESKKRAILFGFDHKKTEMIRVSTDKFNTYMNKISKTKEVNYWNEMRDRLEKQGTNYREAKVLVMISDNPQDIFIAGTNGFTEEVANEMLFFMVNGTNEGSKKTRKQHKWLNNITIKPKKK